VNARFRKGRVYKILQGKFSGIALRYVGFDRLTKEYVFRDGTVNKHLAITFKIDQKHKYAFRQMENEWQS
jgi:hypothetical protein